MPFYPYNGGAFGMPAAIDGGTLTVGYDVVEVDGSVTMPDLVDAANDAAAAAAGVPLHAFYRTGTSVQYRVT